MSRHASRSTAIKNDQSAYMSLVRRARLLALLRHAGWPLATCVAGAQLLQRAVPAGTAIALAWVVSATGVNGSRSPLGSLAASLAAYGAVLWLSHVLDAFGQPLQRLAKLRLDGARRAEIVTLAAGAATIEVLERPEVRDMLRLAKAQPRSWAERTPGDGALGQLKALTSMAGVAMSCAVVARYRLWLVPVVLVPAALVRAIKTRLGNDFLRQWRIGIHEGMTAQARARHRTCR